MLHALVGVLAVAQGPAWTVIPANPTIGDTVVVEWIMPLPEPGVTIRTDGLESSTEFEPLADPEVRYVVDGVVVRHILAPFAPGRVTITMPDIEVIGLDGDSHVVPGGQIIVGVQSVLPGGDSIPAPRMSRAPISRRTDSTTPAVGAGAVALVLVVVWGVARRQTGKRPRWPTTPQRPVNPPIEQWIGAGEPRAVASLAMLRFRERLAELVPTATTAMSIAECLATLRHDRPHWPLREVADAMRALERATFAPAVASDVMRVADEAHEVLKSLEFHDEEEDVSA